MSQKPVKYLKDMGVSFEEIWLHQKLWNPDLASKSGYEDRLKTQYDQL